MNEVTQVILYYVLPVLIWWLGLMLVHRFLHQPVSDWDTDDWVWWAFSGILLPITIVFLIAGGIVLLFSKLPHNWLIKERKITGGGR